MLFSTCTVSPPNPCRIIRDTKLRKAKDSVSSKIIFVDKLAGVPVSATVDNNCENMLYQVQCLLPKSDPPLHLASRLDVCTSGVGRSRCFKLVCYWFKVTFTSLFITPTHLKLPDLLSSSSSLASFLTLYSFFRATFISH
jgi:hypothetical protein